MVLSKNFNGTVKTTGNRGFSVKKTFDKIEATILSMGGVVNSSDSSVRGNSYYLDFDLNDISFEIRISNHTKRGEVCEFGTPKIKTNTCFDKSTYKKVDFQILNTDSKNSFLEFLKTI